MIGRIAEGLLNLELDWTRVSVDERDSESERAQSRIRDPTRAGGPRGSEVATQHVAISGHLHKHKKTRATRVNSSQHHRAGEERWRRPGASTSLGIVD